MKKATKGDKAKARLDKALGHARQRGIEIAYRVRPFLVCDKQELLDEVIRDEDPTLILKATFILFHEALEEFAELEFLLETMLPSITQISRLALRILNELVRLERAQLRYDLARHRGIGCDADHHGASTARTPEAVNSCVGQAVSATEKEVGSSVGRGVRYGPADG